ncbi:MAG TPA: c(7)-type cytochrome triheme domain-containing protein [Novimethylophilus sp.]|jgi:c(7)-type cytochrome triheme protein|uniref:c(7)-type cytochrome triheme domain-containing protein n=1 Tax=Novimethylophilus sp. TaxID=2137426 RepID=UPI002F401937
MRAFISQANEDGRLRLRILLSLLLLSASLYAGAGEWLPLDNDGVHDPSSPAVKRLMEPRDGLSGLAPDDVGNQVRWPQALDQGQINPRTNLLPETKVEVLDKDILLDLYGSMPIVRFPHRIHTLWLNCNNCHEHLFKSKTGATDISMLNILDGEQCGLCHGAVAFPLSKCDRCHSVSRNIPKVKSGGAGEIKETGK